MHTNPMKKLEPLLFLVLVFLCSWASLTDVRLVLLLGHFREARFGSLLRGLPYEQKLAIYWLLSRVF